MFIHCVQCVSGVGREGKGEKKTVTHTRGTWEKKSGGQPWFGGRVIMEIR